MNTTVARPGDALAEDSETTPLLRVEGLNVTYRLAGGQLRAVRDASFDVARGEIFGLVGESGSGKSTLLTALMRLLPHGTGVTADRLELNGTDLLGMSEGRLRKLRGREIGLVPQRPMTSLSPVTPVAAQLRRLTGGEVDDERMHELLTDVGLGGLKRRLGDYPFQFSGGQLQRMLIAVAILAREPGLVLADEPTTTLDATVQAQVLRLMVDLRERLGNTVVLVTHDLGVVAQVCDRVGVMYGGRLVEVARTQDLFDNPQHPYTQALLAAMPSNRPAGARLNPIPGSVSGAHALPGCPFAPRCARADHVCREVDPLPVESAAATVRCHHPGGTE
ncbi:MULTISPECIES: ABC transporter ATP-binding protein [Mumia]|uniref:ABC transporter ATP-binding protein n=1 Tax=Mumia TaxID=1546255 RepID=UPI001423F9A8|nr:MULTISPECIES: ABC transporter ATP-binding protein [unclassified Mumia]QMW66234.1 ABC transporter ATP-binding protein [Mumia sp. ZJ1417]